MLCRPAGAGLELHPIQDVFSRLPRVERRPASGASRNPGFATPSTIAHSSFPQAPSRGDTNGPASPRCSAVWVVTCLSPTGSRTAPYVPLVSAKCMRSGWRVSPARFSGAFLRSWSRRSEQSRKRSSSAGWRREGQAGWAAPREELIYARPQNCGIIWRASLVRPLAARRLFSVAMDFVADPRRDASPAIAGFVYQVYVTILRWIELESDEALELERGEDIDLVPSEASATNERYRRLEQVRDTVRAPTLRSPEAIGAVVNYFHHCRSNPGLSLKFRFLTTARPGRERCWAAPGGATRGVGASPQGRTA